MRAGHAPQAFRDLVRGSGALGRVGQHTPNAVGQANRGQVLGQIIESGNQRPWIPEGPQAGLGQAGGDAEPGLLSDLDQHTVFDGLQLDGERRRSSGGGPRTGGDLDFDVIALTDLLCPQVAAPKLGEERLGHPLR